jgi:hypothetical protein
MLNAVHDRARVQPFHHTQINSENQYIKSKGSANFFRWLVKRTYGKELCFVAKCRIYLSSCSRLKALLCGLLPGNSDHHLACTIFLGLLHALVLCRQRYISKTEIQNKYTVRNYRMSCKAFQSHLVQFHVY